MATRKWRNEILVNATQPGNQDQPAVCALADGGFAVAWRDDGLADSVIRWQRYDALGNAAGAERNSATNFLGDQSAPAITQLSDGNLWIAQTDFDAIGNNDAEGAVFSLATGAFAASRLPAASGNDEQSPRVASLGFSGSVAVWTDLTSTTGDIRMHGFSSVGGNVFGTSTAGVIVNTNAGSLAAAQFAPDVAASKDGQRFVVVWQDDGLSSGDIRARVFDNAGNQITAEFGVNALTTANQQAPAVAWIGPTRFVTAWHSFDPSGGDGSSTAIKYVIRGMDGTQLGSERLANSSTHDVQIDVAITALNDGGFAIAWEDRSNSGPDSDQAIRLQVFDGNGDKRGGEIVVNTTTNSSQIQPALTTLADGRILVSWTDFSTSAGGNGTSIRAQIVDPRDGIVMGSALNDTLYGHDSVADEITGFDGNDDLHGLKGGDSLYGGAGNDDIFGGGGDDTMFGGSGNDQMRGGGGEDEFNGEEGIDAASYNGSKASVTAALDGSLAGKNDAQGDTFLSVENLIGANVAGAGDTLRGNNNANSFNGLDGDDTLQGLNGNDFLRGGLGADAMNGGGGNDRFAYDATTEGGDTITGFSSNAAGNNDVFNFKGAFFGGLPVGPILANQFQSSAAGAAANGNVRFFYETDTGILRFDADGDGAGAAAVIATLTGAPAVALSDIVIF